MAIRGSGAEFTRQLRMGWMSRGTQDAVVRLGQAGYVTRAMVIAGIGIAALDAAITYDPAKAKGVDGVLRSFASHSSPLAAHPRRSRADRVRGLVIRSCEMAPHPRRSPCLSKVYSSPERGWVSRLRPSWPALHG